MGTLIPVIRFHDGVHMAVFTTAQESDFSKFALAFIQGSANNHAKVTMEALKSITKQPVATPKELSNMLETLQKEVSTRYSKYHHLKAETGHWTFIWVCYPYQKGRNDVEHTPQNPRRTVLKLLWGPARKWMEISSGRKTSVDRRVKAALGQNAPLAWKTITGLEEHPKL